MFSEKEQRVLGVIIAIAVVGTAFLLIKNYNGPLNSEEIEIYVCGNVIKSGSFLVRKKDTFRQILNIARMAKDNFSEFTIETIDPEENVPVKFQVNINKAGKTELQSIPGIGPKLAENIFFHRIRQVRFARVEELMSVKGIGPGKYEKLKEYVCLEDKTAGPVPGRFTMLIPDKKISVSVGADSQVMSVLKQYISLKPEQSEGAKMQDIEKIPLKLRMEVR